MMKDSPGSGMLSRLVQELPASTHHLLPGANRAGPGWGCAEAALGTCLDQHTVMWLCVNSHSIARACEHEPLGTNFEPGSGNANVKHSQRSHKTSNLGASRPLNPTPELESLL